VLIAPFFPATSPSSAYRLILTLVLGGGSAILFLGIILTGAFSLPAEIRDRTIHRSAASPGGRLSILTGRIIAFSIIAAFATLIGMAGTLASLGLHSLNTDAPENSQSTYNHYRALAAQEHKYADKPLVRKTQGVLWIDDKFPCMEWIFPVDSLPGDSNLQLRIVPVVASTLETEARISASRKDSDEVLFLPLRLFDNRPTDIEFPGLPAGTGSLHVRIERLSNSAPFGFDIDKNELNVEKNGVSLLTGMRLFMVNLFAAWFVVWLKLSFAASVAIFASTFLSAPVAAAFSLVLFLLANVLGFLREFAAGLLKPVGCGCIHCQFRTAEYVPTAFDRFISSFLDWFTRLYPDLSRFDSSEALVWGTAIPAGFILLALLYYIAYSGILWGASALILRRKEF